MDENGLIEVPYVNVTLSPGVMSKKTVLVMAHEIPMLMVNHGEDNVQVGQSSGDTKWVYPDEEYARLENRYGSDKGGTLVKQTFGMFREGRLSDLMERSLKMFPLPTAEEVKAEDLEGDVDNKPRKEGRSRGDTTVVSIQPEKEDDITEEEAAAKAAKKAATAAKAAATKAANKAKKEADEKAIRDSQTDPA